MFPIEPSLLHPHAPGQPRCAGPRADVMLSGQQPYLLNMHFVVLAAKREHTVNATPFSTIKALTCHTFGFLYESVKDYAFPIVEG